jgi:hypothetical protein
MGNDRLFIVEWAVSVQPLAHGINLLEHYYVYDMFIEYLVWTPQGELLFIDDQSSSIHTLSFSRQIKSNGTQA